MCKNTFNEITAILNIKISKTSAPFNKSCKFAAAKIITIMLKKITLLLFICCIVSFGFAQKSKKKNNPSPKKNDYFEITVNGSTKIQDLYCPNTPLEFDFNILDTTLNNLKFCWVSSYIPDPICNVTPIVYSFPLIGSYKVTLTFVTPTDSVIVSDFVTINVDFSRHIEVVEVCQGKKITIPTLTHGDITFLDIQEDNLCTPWDTLKYQSVNGCDSLVRWCIKMKPYEKKEYKISSCDSVKWGDVIYHKPNNLVKDTSFTAERIHPYPTLDPCCNCDTLIKLHITIIDTGRLIPIFDQKAFCAGDDMKGTISLETNFTAFDWKIIETDSTWTVLRDTIIDITTPGFYYVLAYMDTSLYDTLKDLRIVNCSKSAVDTVKDCKLIIPNVITPNGDNINDVFGIKKLNLIRENELTIYDRWGKVVYHKRNYKCVYREGGFQNIEEAFDGKSRGGQDLPEGTYYYAFKYKAFPKDSKQIYTGSLLIIR